MVDREPKHLPQGVARCGSGAAEWRVWAPHSPEVTLVTWPDGRRRDTPMAREGFGYFTCRQEGVAEGLRYAYRLADGNEYPDPASCWQPDGVHRPSAVLFPGDFPWSDAGWRGVPREDLVIYELHVGTFSPEGTFDGVIARLADLVSLGVTAVEIMPVGEFPGARNWGYDGAFPYAVQDSYGGPHGLNRLVDAAHHAGLAVLLDVVYNHLGPEGNYLGKYGPYFTDRYRTPWGSAVNFDGPHCDAVRRYFIDNACMWIRDYHVDGLRLDAVHAIFDLGARHILADIEAAVQEEAVRQDRIVHVIAESNQNDVRLVDPAERGGYGLDGVWADDFHHAVHALLTGEREGYYADFGDPEQVAKALREAFVYDGCYSGFRRRRHGSKTGDRDRTKFIACIQNHDQVGNRARGDRLDALIPPAARRLACGLLLLSPATPLLFMGEEYGERRPFPFFCSFGDPALMEAVRRGRREEFAAMTFQWGNAIPDPQAPETFQSALLEWSWPPDSLQGKLRLLYQDLLAARRHWPPLRDRRHTAASMVDASRAQHGTPKLLVIERGDTEKIIAYANLGKDVLQLSTQYSSRRTRYPILSTEDCRYGGTRAMAEPVRELLPYELVIFGDISWRLPA